MLHVFEKKYSSRSTRLVREQSKAELAQTARMVSERVRARSRYTSGLTPRSVRFLKNDVQIPLCNEFDDHVTTTTCKTDVSFRELSREPPPASSQSQRTALARHASHAPQPHSRAAALRRALLHARSRTAAPAPPCAATSPHAPPPPPLLTALLHACPRTLPLLPYRAAQPRLTTLPPTNPNLRSRLYTSLE